MGLSYRIIQHAAVIAFDHVDASVNILNEDVLKRLSAMIDEVAQQKTIKAVVFLSMKKNCFIAGADIKEIEKIVESDDGAMKAKAGQDVMNKIEDLKVPTIAVIDGVALGGGCELALACDYRISTFNDKVRIGLPEVNLGFVPGFGGCYRLPRIIGLQEGLKMILAGRPIDGSKALRIGLFDKIFPQKNLEVSVHKFVHDVVNGNFHKNKYAAKKLKGINKILEGTDFGRNIVYKASRKSVMKLSKGFYPAPLKAINVIKDILHLDRTAGLKIEREAFGQLAITDVSKSLVKVFYMSEKYRKLTPESIKDIKPQIINKAGVLGAGVMGGGIAQLLSSKDIWTRVKDLNYEALALGLRSANTVYRQAVKKRKLTKAQAIVKMDHITSTLDYSGFQSVGIVIEAVLEKMDVKKAVFKELSEKVSDTCVLASNTSALSVTEMAHATKNPSRVIGFHFFNPVHRMPLVELITTEQTSPETLATSLSLVKRLGKTPIVCKDSPGFIVNRILLAYMSEAGRILEENGQLEAIDRIMTDFGMPMGPFLLSDEVGLDVGLKVMRILEDAFGERFTPAGLFQEVLDKKLLGKKTKKGFYVHGKKRKVNPDVIRMIDVSNDELDEKTLLKRMVYIMINEAAACLEDGVVDDPAAIDIGMIFGTGFPPFRGGLLQYADAVGVDTIVDDMEQLCKDLDTTRFKPCRHLQDLKDKGTSFYGS